MWKMQMLLSEIRSSLWFVPTLIVLGSVCLALALIEADTAFEREWLTAWPRLFGAGAEGSRGMLEAIAGSMITVAGVVFSMTIVALSLTSNQYSPRVLRNFMRDRTNQTVLGVFVGIFAYCLVVLRTIRGGEEGVFIPSLAILVGIGLAFVGIGYLIFFIHHIANSIQASRILAAVHEETRGAIDHLFPKGLGKEERDEEEPILEIPLEDLEWKGITANATGYIQSVDADALLAVARDCKTTLRMERGIGDFVIDGTMLAYLAGTTENIDDAKERINGAFLVNPQRTVEQDAAFGIRQIVDVAIKALSPGINDTTTAVMCVHYLSSLLARLAPRRIESPYRYEEGELRVIARRPGFEEFLREAFDQIRQNSAGNVAMLRELLAAFEAIGSVTEHPERRQALGRQVEAVAEVVERTIPAVRDREELAEQAQIAAAKCARRALLIVK